jgi:hypothetical protein
MILIAGGDSFVFGSELQDQINDPSLLTFPALLAKENNLEYHCVAWPANANNAISRMVIAECEKQKHEKIAVLVSWSFTQRYEFRFNFNTGQKITPWYSISPWSTIDDVSEIIKEYRSDNLTILQKQKENMNRAKNSGISEFAKNFYKHVGDSEYYELYSSFKEFLFLQNYLENNKIPYIFTTANNSFYLHDNYQRSKDSYLETLYNLIDWQKWYFFKAGSSINESQFPRGFYQWAIENKYPMGTTHPLEEAHYSASILLKEKFNELVKKSL